MYGTYNVAIMGATGAEGLRRCYTESETTSHKATELHATSTNSYQ